MDALNHDQVKKAIRSVGTILSCDNSEFIDLLLYNGLLDKFEKMLHDHQDQLIFKEVIWCLGNLTAGSEEHQKSFLSNKNLVEKIFML